jgi:hypothetical protein
MLHSALPYALAFLEEKERPDLIQEVLNSNFGLFGIVYTDLDGKVLFTTSSDRHRFSESAVANATGYSYVYEQPHEQQIKAGSPYDSLSISRANRHEGKAYGRIYLLGGFSQSIFKTLTLSENWERLLPGGRPPSDYFLSVLTNMGVIFVIGILCITGARLDTRQRKTERDQHDAELTVLAQRVELNSIEIGALEKVRELLRKELRSKENILAELLQTMRTQSELAAELKHDRDAIVEAHRVAEKDRAEAEQEFYRVDDELKAVAGERDRLIERLEEATSVPIRATSDLRSQRLLEIVFPSLSFSTRAADQLQKARRASKGASKKLFHLLCGLEAGDGDLLKVPGHFAREVKKWRSSGSETVWEIKLPPSRVYCRQLEKKELSVEFVVVQKDDRSDKDVQNYFK